CVPLGDAIVLPRIAPKLQPSTIGALNEQFDSAAIRADDPPCLDVNGFGRLRSRQRDAELPYWPYLRRGAGCRALARGSRGDWRIRWRPCRWHRFQALRQQGWHSLLSFWRRSSLRAGLRGYAFEDRPGVNPALLRCGANCKFSRTCAV